MNVIYEQFTGKDNVLIFPGISSCACMIANIGGGQLVGAHFSYKTDTTRRASMLARLKTSMGTGTVNSMYFVGNFSWWKGLKKAAVDQCRTVLGYGGKVLTSDLALKSGKEVALKASPEGTGVRVGYTKDLQWTQIEGNRYPSTSEFKDLKGGYIKL